MDSEQGAPIAVVDDDSDVREVLEGLLAILGHHVKTYSSGQELLEGGALEDLSCLVVDQKMPEMTGLQLLVELDRRGINVPSLLITGDKSMAEEARRLGATQVLTKPISYRKFLKFIEHCTG
jgi:two-component system response regulator FixJ